MFLLPTSRPDELRTDEKVGAKGDAVAEGLVDDSGRRADESEDDTSVANGVRPRREVD